MASDNKTHKSMTLESFKQAIIQEPHTKELKTYFQQKGLVLDSKDERDLDLFFSTLADLLSDKPKEKMVSLKYILSLEHDITNNCLGIWYDIGIEALFDYYKDGYFYNKCGKAFLLDPNPILFPPWNKKSPPIEGGKITDEVEQDKVGLSALAMQASYSKKADRILKKEYLGLSAAQESLYLAAESAFRKALIYDPDDIFVGENPKDPDAIYDMFKSNYKGFSVELVPLDGCGLALLIHGNLATKSGEKHEYYIIAIRGTHPAPLIGYPNPWDELPEKVGAERWYKNIITDGSLYHEFQARYHIRDYFRDEQAYKYCLNLTDVLNDILAEPVDFKLPGDEKVFENCENSVHQGFYEKARSLYEKLRVADKEGKKPKFGDGKTLDEILIKISHNTDKTQHLIITGHSQGASAALVVSALIRFAVYDKKIYDENKQLVTLDQLADKMELITFAQASVGNKRFITQCKEKLKIDPGYKHFIREGDYVALVPGNAWNPNQTEKAEHFGTMLFEKTKDDSTGYGINPIHRLEGIKKEDDEIKETVKNAIFDDMCEAHRADLYLNRVYTHYAEGFANKWLQKD
jgi:hypothetical protein